MKRACWGPAHRRGFTLIELMIVIAIIAVIAAIAVPNLLQASIASNETAAVVNLREIAGGQSIFKSTDWYGIGGKSYTVWAPHLFEFTSGAGENKQPHLINRAMAQAFGADLAGTDAIAMTGYVFHDITDSASITPLTTGDAPVLHFAYEAVPSQYESTGRVTFVMNATVVVYSRDLSGAGVGSFPAELSDWTVVTE